jgi:hypothetical protein
MLVRDLVGLTREQIAEIGNIEGYPVQEVCKYSSSYGVRLGTGDIILAKGHDTLGGLRRARQARSADVIQSYGRYGSSIGVPYRG